MCVRVHVCARRRLCVRCLILERDADRRHVHNTLSQTTHSSDSSQTRAGDDRQQTGWRTDRETDSAAGPESHRSLSAHETHQHKHMAPEERGAKHNDALTGDSGCKKKTKKEQDCEMVNLD